MFIVPSTKGTQHNADDEPDNHLGQHQGDHAEEAAQRLSDGDPSGWSGPTTWCRECFHPIRQNAILPIASSNSSGPG